MRIGFYKAKQGAFTEEVIIALKDRLARELDADVVEVDFRKGVLIDGRVYVGDICVNDFDVYFWHDTLWPAKTGSDSYYIHLLRAIQKDTLVINTADSTECVNDKLLAHEKLHRAGLPVSEYALVYSEDRDGIARAMNELGGDVLIKPRFGGWGRGIVHCASIGDLQDSIELAVAVSGKEQQFLLEKFYPNNADKWISISMIGCEPVIGYRKLLSVGGSDWKVYDPEKKDGRGENSVFVKPTGVVRDLAIRAQAALGKDIVGFDFISTADGYKIVDENGRPGLYKHCLDAAGVDIVERIVELVRTRAADIA